MINDLPKDLIESSKKVLEKRYDHKFNRIVIVRGDKEVENAQKVAKKLKLKSISIKRQVKKPNIGNIVTFDGDEKELQKLHKELQSKEKALNKYIYTFESISESSAEYQAFFKKTLEKFGVSSPADFDSEEKKKEFFDYIDKNYKGEKEEG